MTTAKLFKNGASQAVRLPKDCRFKGRDVYIRRIGDIVILLPKTDPWQSLVRSLDTFSDDFMTARKQPGPSQVREEF
jgi:antitoxin VapB